MLLSWKFIWPDRSLICFSKSFIFWFCWISNFSFSLLLSERYSSTLSNVRASILLTPEETDSSLIIRNLLISVTSFTWVPPHNSIEYGLLFLDPRVTTLTSSPYFSPNNAIALQRLEKYALTNDIFRLLMYWRRSAWR